MTPAAIQERITRTVSGRRRARLAQVGQAAEQRGWPLYLVGGFVRDLLLGLPPDDFDVVVEGDAPALARDLAQRWGGEVRQHAPFGTAAWTTPDGVEIDLASARTETYPQPAALPVVSVPASLRADLDRRDFTINAIALPLSGTGWGELVDPHAGQADLAARQVRVLHPRSFQDDPTRLFRAVRYERRLEFTLAPATQALIPAARAALPALSGDRLRHELELIFRENRTADMLARLDDLGLLAAAHPSLAWGPAPAEAAALIAAGPWRAWRLEEPPEPDALWLVLLLRGAPPEGAAAALERLNPKRATTQAVREALVLRQAWSRPSEAVAVLDEVSELGVLAAYVAWPALRPDLEAYLNQWRWVRAAHTGADLIARGLTPGPRFKALLWRLRAARLDGAAADAAGEAALLERWLAEAGPEADPWTPR